MESKEYDLEATDPVDVSAYDKPEADPADAGDVAAHEPHAAEPPVKAGKYRVLSLIIFVLTAGGLFLGLLGNVVDWFAPSYYRSGVSGLDNSLLGFFIAHMKELGSLSTVLSGSTVSIVKHAVAILAALLILVSLITTLVSFILTFVLPKRAKTAAAVGGAVGLFAYTMLFLWACCIESVHMSAFDTKAIDVPVAIIMLALLIVVTVDAILTGGLQGLLSAGIYVFTVAACFAFFFPASFTESHLTLLKGLSSHLFYNLAVLAALAFILLNLLLSVITLAGKLRGVPQIVLSALQLAAVVILAVAACLLDKSEKFSFFLESALLPSVVLVISSIGSLLLAIIILILKKNMLSETEEVKEPETTSYAYVAAPVSPAEESAEEAAPVEPEALPVEDVELCAAEDVSEAVEEPAEPAELLAEPETPVLSEEEPEREMTEWEKEMLSLAEKGAETPAESSEQPFPYPPYPYDRQSAPAPRPFSYYADPSTQYIYDPFINELTSEEKNEFGDLFIACKAGKYGDLPEYRIGGDNKEFFEKVWIRYGLYDMSPSLRDKLFNYLRKYRKN